MAPNSEACREFPGRRVEETNGPLPMPAFPVSVDSGASQVSQDGVLRERQNTPSFSHREKLLKLPRGAYQSPSRSASSSEEAPERTRNRRPLGLLAPETVSAFLSATRVADSAKRAAAAESAAPTELVRHGPTDIIASQDQHMALSEGTLGGYSSPTKSAASQVLSGQVLSSLNSLAGPQFPMTSQHPAVLNAQVAFSRSVSAEQLQMPAGGMQIPQRPLVYSPPTKGASRWPSQSQQDLSFAFRGPDINRLRFQQGQAHYRYAIAPANPSQGARDSSPPRNSEGATGDTMPTSPLHHSENAVVAVDRTMSLPHQESPAEEITPQQQPQQQQQSDQQAAAAAALHPLFVEQLSGFDEPRQDMLAEFCTMLTLAIRSMANPLGTFCADVGQPRGAADISSGSDPRMNGLKRKLAPGEAMEAEGRSSAVRSRTDDVHPTTSGDSTGCNAAAVMGLAEAQSTYIHPITSNAPGALHLDDAGGHTAAGNSLAQSDHTLGDLSTHVEGFSFEAFQQSYLGGSAADTGVPNVALYAANVAPGGGVMALGAGDVAQSFGDVVLDDGDLMLDVEPKGGAQEWQTDDLILSPIADCDTQLWSTVAK